MPLGKRYLSFPPNQGLNPRPWQGKHQVLPTGLPGKSFPTPLTLCIYSYGTVVFSWFCFLILWWMLWNRIHTKFCVQFQGIQKPSEVAYCPVTLKTVAKGLDEHDLAPDTFQNSREEGTTSTDNQNRKLPYLITAIWQIAQDKNLASHFSKSSAFSNLPEEKALLFRG